LKGKNEHVIIEREDIEGNHKVDPLYKLIFRCHHETKEIVVNDMGPNEKRVYRVGPNLAIKCETH
jgi:hypothetical protein